MDGVMKIFAVWDAWSCELDYYANYDSALHKAREVAEEHFGGELLGEILNGLEAKKEIGEEMGEEKIEYITIEEIYVKE